ASIQHARTSTRESVSLEESDQSCTQMRIPLMTKRGSATKKENRRMRRSKSIRLRLLFCACGCMLRDAADNGILARWRARGRIFPFAGKGLRGSAPRPPPPGLHFPESVAAPFESEYFPQLPNQVHPNFGCADAARSDLNRRL